MVLLLRGKILWENSYAHHMLRKNYSDARKCSGSPDGHLRVPHLYWDSMLPIRLIIGTIMVFFFRGKISVIFGEIPMHTTCFTKIILMLENVQIVQIVISESPICIGTQ